MIWIDAVLAIPCAYFIAVSAYLATLTVAAAFFRRTTSESAEPVTISILVPAHNEESIIASTLRNLKKADYPAEQRRIILLADNCSDRTVEVAIKAGITVVERNDPANPGKPSALDWCFRNRWEMIEPADVVVIVDADAIVAPDFFLRIRDGFNAPAVEIVQSFYGVANAHRAWRAGIVSVGFLLKNHIRNAGRLVLGGSANLCGSGMGFRASVLRDTGWPTVTLGEDHEFALKLILDGRRVHYLPEALLTSDMPETKQVARTQRSRWDFSGFQLRRRYLMPLLRRAVRDRDWAAFDAAVELSVLPLALFVTLMFVSAIIAAFAATPYPAIAIVAAAVATAFHVFAGLIIGRAPRAAWIALCMTPYYVFSKVPLYLSFAVGRGPKVFLRTNRETRDDATMSGDDL